ncbi:hypothetical protein ACHAQA_001492 [Verticillium albo-atrum]
MCTSELFTTVYADGSEKRTRQDNRCSKVPSGFLCANPRIVNHPTVYETASSSHFPPTPRLTPYGSPRPSTPLAYSSANESDNSRRSSDRKRVYIAGQKVIDVTRKSGKPRARDERIIIVDGPPTPRTPPQHFAMPFTAPSSPRTGYQMAAAHHARRERERDSLRPVIVDERPSRHVHFGAASPAYLSPNSRQQYAAEPAYAAPSSDDERRRRRSHRETRYHDTPEGHQRQADRERARELERIIAAQQSSRRQPQQEADPEVERNIRKAERIARLNERIDARPAVPVPTLRRTATDFTGEERERELREAVRGLDLNERVLRRSQTNTTMPRRDVRREQQAVEEEEEAQRRRLAERMMPRRRATVGPGSRRHRVLYDDGMYRWE